MNCETIGDRIRQIIGDNVSAFARRSGVSESLLRQYMAGSKPGLEKAAAIASTAGVSMEWLATGVRQELTENNHIGCDAESLVLAIETVEEGLAVTGRVMRPARKAELVMAVYELFTESAGKVDRGIVLRLVKSAS